MDPFGVWQMAEDPYTAFKVIRHIGQGFLIIVSSKPKETTSFNSLHDPTDVKSFLLHLA
ncbi:putative trehalose-phosphate phosphatase 3 [Senna tora]|uniref:Putative trehalose-phosphate phosphatase 3 n=1 Tax=Senna tora TaxID=362788 RepID=A0A834XGF3_9FABA|nr:putative trehalose-phosphate phosphatase 3 [Senna tora]